MMITRVFEDMSIVVYRRHRKKETWVPLYFEYDRMKCEETGREWKTIREVEAYLKKSGHKKTK